MLQNKKRSQWGSKDQRPNIIHHMQIKLVATQCQQYHIAYVVVAVRILPNFMWNN